MTALEAHSHFDSSAVWSFREAEPNKSRVVSVCMLNVRDNVKPSALDLATPSAKPSASGEEVVDEGLLRYETENGCYQAMVQRRPFRKCWWEMVSVMTSLDELERLKGEDKVKESSLRNLVGKGKKDGDLRKSMENLGGVKEAEESKGKKGSGRVGDGSVEVKCWVRKTWLAEFVQA
jgi:hypothetical protein